MTPEPRVVVVKRYRCAFCPRGYSVRKRCVDHMEHCYANPDHITRAKSSEPPVTWGDEF